VSYERTVTVVVPVYNEAPRVDRVVADVVATLGRGVLPFRVLVLDDGSTDWTDELDRSLRSHGPVDIRRFHPNRGKGAVLADALPTLDTAWAVVLDADGEYAASDLPALLAPLADGNADWVIGSRYGFGRPRPPQALCASIANRAIGACFAALSGVHLHDLLSGVYAFRCSGIDGLVLRERRFSYTAELMWEVCRRGLRIVEVPVAYRFRTYAEGKKIRWWEAATIMAALVRYRPRAGGRTG
jgi:glycosyltransferase involved in cell wall biosynthesis